MIRRYAGLSSFDILKSEDPKKIKIVDTRYYSRHPDYSVENKLSSVIGFSYLNVFNLGLETTVYNLYNTAEIKPDAYDNKLSFEKELADGFYGIKFGTLLYKDFYIGNTHDEERAGLYVVDRGTGSLQVSSEVSSVIVYDDILPIVTTTQFDSKYYLKYSEIYKCFSEKLEKYYCMIQEGKSLNCCNKDFKDFLYLQNAISYFEALLETNVNSNFFSKDFVVKNELHQKMISEISIEVDDTIADYQEDFSVDFDQSRWNKDFYGTPTPALIENIVKIIENCKTICCCKC